MQYSETGEISVRFHLQGAVNFRWLKRGVASLIQRSSCSVIKRFDEERVNTLPSKIELRRIKREFKAKDPIKYWNSRMSLQQKIEAHINDWLDILQAKSFSYE